MKHFLLLTSILSYLFLISCNGTKSKEEQKVYNIPEIDKLSEEIRKNPKNAALYAARCVLFGEHELFKESEIDAEKALSLDSSKIDYYTLLSEAYFNNNHSHAAIKTLQKAIGRFPQEAKLYTNLAELQLTVEQYKDCVYTIDMLFKVSPENPQGFFIKGLVAKYTGDSTRSVDFFKQVVARDADHVDAYMELALFFNQKGDPVTLAYLENVLRIDSLHEGALLTKAQYYHFRSEYEQAEKEYDNAILKHPQNADFNYNLAIMYLEMGDEAKEKGNKEKSKKYYESALRHFDNSTKFDVQFADAYYYKAIAAERLDRKDLAKTDYENALRLQTFLQTVYPETVENALAKLK